MRNDVKLDVIETVELRKLANLRGSNFVSIYLPFDYTGSAHAKERKKLKTMLLRAEKQLQDKGLKDKEIDDILSYHRSLIASDFFWSDGGAGLAILATEEKQYTYRLTAPVSESLYVGHRFYLKPLISLSGQDDNFHVLTVNMKKPQLFECSMLHCQKIENVSLPVPPEEYFPGDKHVSQPPAKARYITDLAQELHKLYASKDRKLILVGLGQHVGPLKEVLDLPNIKVEAIERNSEELSPQEIQKIALDTIEDNRKTMQKKYLQDFHNAKNSNRSTASVKEVLLGAKDGRVATLFIADEVQLWGQVLEDRSLRTNVEKESGEDLLDLAAVETLLHDGEVITMSRDEVPGGTMAAILRY